MESAHTEALADAFSDEKARWMENAKDLTRQYDHLIGDILLSSGIIVYLGAFNSVFRQVRTEYNMLRTIQYSDLFLITLEYDK